MKQNYQNLIQWLFVFIKIKLNRAQNMIETHNQTIDLLKFRSENNVEICLPILYMCLSKQFKKEDYERLTKGGNVYSKVVFWKGQILIKNCVLKAERIEAQGGLMSLKYPFLICLNSSGCHQGQGPGTLVSF